MRVASKLVTGSTGVITLDKEISELKYIALAMALVNNPNPGTQYYAWALYSLDNGSYTLQGYASTWGSNMLTITNVSGNALTVRQSVSASTNMTIYVIYC